VSTDVGSIELVAAIERKRDGSDLCADHVQGVAGQREHGRGRHRLVATLAEHEYDEEQGVHPAHRDDDIVGTHTMSFRDQCAEPRITLAVP
jgi:hypothetical protein